MVSNEVFVGAGTMATLVPEMDMYFDSMKVTHPNLNTVVLHTDDSSKFKFLTNLYVGCRAKVTNSNPSTAVVYHVMITSNTENGFTFDTDVSDITTGEELVDVKLLGFGAPVIAPSTSNQKLLSDNWLGLVNSFSPPSVDVETKQLALMGGNTRNLSLQYRGAETVSGGSLDVSLNNGSWSPVPWRYSLTNVSRPLADALELLFDECLVVSIPGIMISQRSCGSLCPGGIIRRMSCGPR